MIRLDSQILPMKCKIVLAKIRAIARTMGTPSDNLCRLALIEGQRTCNGEELLTECMLGRDTFSKVGLFAKHQ